MHVFPVLRTRCHFHYFSTYLNIIILYFSHRYPLVGESVQPEPRGPFLVSAGESISMEISNPFDDTMTFKFSVDNSIFQVKPTEESIKAKTSIKITISSSARRISKFEIGNVTSEAVKTGFYTGKLTVVCENDVKWIYYLQCQVTNK